MSDSPNILNIILIEIKLKLDLYVIRQIYWTLSCSNKSENNIWVIGQIYWTLSWSNKSEKWPLSEPFPKAQIMRWLRLSNGPSSGYYKVYIYSTIQVFIANQANRTNKVNSSNKVKRPFIPHAFNFDRFNQFSTGIIFKASISLNLDWSTFDESYYHEIRLENQLNRRTSNKQIQ